MADTPPPFDPSKPFTTVPAAGATPPPFDPSKPYTVAPASTSPPQEKPKTQVSDTDPLTTLSGISGAVTRGLAPIATGAAIGAAAGAPFAGVGAVPGAIAGGAAVGLTELATSVYDALAPHMGAPKVVTPQEATDKVLDWFKVKRPSTTAEQLTETAAGMAPFGMGSAKGVEDLGEMVAQNAAGAGERYIKNAYSRVIKPSTTGRDTVLQRRSAISDIVENKPRLKYTDENGSVVSAGHLPQTVEQFGQAIDQAKSKLFKEWDALTQQAGQKGAMVPTDGLVKELRAKAADAGLLRDDPAAAAYAGDLADRYEAAGHILPSEAQEAISRWNQKLKPYYNNPGYENPAGEVVARNLRESLDKTITDAVAPGYQELKKRYGSLSAIEKDVDRATRRISNREAGGGIMGRGIDRTAIAELAIGAAAGHGLEGLGAAALTKGTGEFIKWLRNPNRVIKEMFNTAEKYHKPLGIQTTPFQSIIPTGTTASQATLGINPSRSFAGVPEVEINGAGGFDVHTNSPAGVLWAATREDANKLASQYGLIKPPANAP
jgi:hypothetical protein